MHHNAGRKQTPEHIAKRVASWRKTIDIEKLRERCRAMAVSQVGKIQPPEAIEKQRAKMMGRATAWLKGRKQSEAHRRAVSAYWAANREKHNHYIDGRGAARGNARTADMGRIEYRLWREKVFERDNWTCVMCGERGVELHADHIKPYAFHPELRYDIDNGRALCVPCHKTTPTFAGRVHMLGVKKECRSP